MLLCLWHVRAYCPCLQAMYGVYHGPHGLKAIATRVHQMARVFADGESCAVLQLSVSC